MIDAIDRFFSALVFPTTVRVMLKRNIGLFGRLSLDQIFSENTSALFGVSVTPSRPAPLCGVNAVYGMPCNTLKIAQPSVMGFRVGFIPNERGGGGTHTPNKKGGPGHTVSRRDASVEDASLGLGILRILRTSVF